MTSVASDRPQLAAYYFGNWHRDPRSQAWLGDGWTEWEIVRSAKPRFPGHAQPKRPLWGYTDDAEPADWEREAAAAYDAGIDAFIVDWYWNDGLPMLDRPLDEAILPSRSLLKFALMWANHPYTNVYPAPHGKAQSLLASPVVDAQGFRDLTQRVIDRYMSSPRYWRIGGAAYYSIYAIDPLVEWLGGVASARRAFDDFRERARAAGVGELHLATVPTQFVSGDGAHNHLAELGFDSVNDYNWAGDWPAGQSIVPYSQWRERAEARRYESKRKVDVVYAPNVSVGWDSTPRTEPGLPVFNEEWPYWPVVTDNNPAEFEIACRNVLRWAREQGSPYISVNAWNEWTEGAYLEPDEEWGTSKLEALKRVFGR